MNVEKRTLSIEGMNNFRDMGGYRTIDGRRVKWGMLYRSDQICNATEKGMIALRKLGIRTIIDYRSKDEIGKYPNPIIDSSIKTYQLDPDAHTAELSAQFTSSADSEDENLVNKIIQQKEQGLLVNQYDMVLEQYKNFTYKPNSQNAFATMLRVAAEAENAPILQHCRGGKDRTGYGGMLILGALGVAKEDIIYDFMLTHENRIQRNQIKMEIYRQYTTDQVILDYLYSLIETRPEFIETSMNEIEQKYGNINTYIINELGVGPEMIEKLKEIYLTS